MMELLEGEARKARVWVVDERGRILTATENTS